jgi:hypothetical protein
LREEDLANRRAENIAGLTGCQSQLPLVSVTRGRNKGGRWGTSPRTPAAPRTCKTLSRYWLPTDVCSIGGPVDRHQRCAQGAEWVDLLAWREVPPLGLGEVSPAPERRGANSISWRPPGHPSKRAPRRMLRQATASPWKDFGNHSRPARAAACGKVSRAASLARA